MSLGNLNSLKLRAWARDVRIAFGGNIYLVGSATKTKEWRDVDVVCMLNLEEYTKLFGDLYGHGNLKWEVLCTAVCIWGTEVTGLPIDFKFQEIELANETHKGNREPLSTSLDTIKKGYPLRTDKK
jgi:predicted nucleotidyltransferase